MEDLGAKLHEAEYAKSQWIPISEIPYDQIPQQKALLKVSLIYCFLIFFICNILVSCFQTELQPIVC